MLHTPNSFEDACTYFTYSRIIGVCSILSSCTTWNNEKLLRWSAAHISSLFVLKNHGPFIRGAEASALQMKSRIQYSFSCAQYPTFSLGAGIKRSFIQHGLQQADVASRAAYILKCKVALWVSRLFENSCCRFVVLFQPRFHLHSILPATDTARAPHAVDGINLIFTRKEAPASKRVPFTEKLFKNNNWTPLHHVGVLWEHTRALYLWKLVGVCMTYKLTREIFNQYRDERGKPGGRLAPLCCCVYLILKVYDRCRMPRNVKKIDSACEPAACLPGQQPSDELKVQKNWSPGKV